MKHAIAATVIALSAIAAGRLSAEPILMLNEPRDAMVAKSSCGSAADEVKADQYLIKANQCVESDLCQRAITINAACKVTGPEAEVRGFHSKLLAQLASNAQCNIAIKRQPENAGEVSKAPDWELNLGFAPGFTKQAWALWPYKDGRIIGSGVLEGEGDAAQIARDICTIMTRSGAKILN